MLFSRRNSFLHVSFARRIRSSLRAKSESDAAAAAEVQREEEEAAVKDVEGNGPYLPFLLTFCVYEALFSDRSLVS